MATCSSEMLFTSQCEHRSTPTGPCLILALLDLKYSYALLALLDFIRSIALLALLDFISSIAACGEDFGR